MLLPFQGANTIRLALPRVSSHVVRLALGCALLAFQAVFSSFISNLSRVCFCPFRAQCVVIIPTQGVVSLGSPCPGLCAFGLSGRIFFVYIES